MDRTGAPWSLMGAEAVLRLRALRASGDFDPYWDFHRGRERSATTPHATTMVKSPISKADIQNGQVSDPARLSARRRRATPKSIAARSAWDAADPFFDSARIRRIAYRPALDLAGRANVLSADGGEVNVDDYSAAARAVLPSWRSGRGRRSVDGGASSVCGAYCNPSAADVLECGAGRSWPC